MRTIFFITIIFALTIPTLSCQSQTTKSLKADKEIPEDWQKIETEYFSFSIPPTMKRTDLHGTDSQMMGFEDDEITLELDYGMYSTNIESLRFNQQKEPIIIDGEETTLISFDENKTISLTNEIINKDASERFGKVDKHYIIGVNFPRESEVITPGFKFAASFIASCKTLEAQENAKMIFYSIKFKRK